MGNLTKILYVDVDQEAIAAFLQLFGNDSRYAVMTAGSGAEGLEILSGQSDVHLVVADYRLPGMDGVEFLGRVCEQWPDITRVVLAHYADVAPVIEAINEGRIYKFVPKPWSPEDFKCTLLTVLQHQKLQKQNVHLQKDLLKKSARLEALQENLEKIVAQRTEVLQIRNRVLRISQGVLDVLPVAVFGIDAEQMIVQCNDLARDLFPAGFMGPIGSDRKEVFPDELNRLIDQAEPGKPFSAPVAIRERSYRLEIRGLDESLARGRVIALIPC